MARASIYKSEVLRARNNLLAQGRYPSIDSVRIELGNTGSKATIHRYLKEIEEEEGGSVGTKVAVSEALQSLIGRLAERLHEEADERITEINAKHAAELQQNSATLDALREEISALRLTQEQVQAELEVEQGRRLRVEASLSAESVIRAQVEQQASDLHDQLNSEIEHRKSLEEKYADARKSLEHFRETAKEHRDQELRQHEQLVQYLQSELRGANLKLTEQQHKFADLNQEMARVTNDLGSAKRELRRAESKLKNLEPTQDLLLATTQQRDELERRLGIAEREKELLATDNRSVIGQIQDLSVRNQDLQLKLVTSEARLEAQNLVVTEFREQVAGLFQQGPKTT